MTAIDVLDGCNAVAIAEAGRAGEVRFLAEIENTETGVAKLVRMLSAKCGRLTFCYEAGPDLLPRRWIWSPGRGCAGPER
jgi:hypothetical protein